MSDMPHSEEAERGLLACVLMDGAAGLSKALDGKIVDECFYAPLHKKVWRSILWLHNHNQPIELVILAEELKKKGKLDELGGMDALLAVSRDVPTTAQFTYFIEQVREAYVRRCLIENAEAAIARARAGGGSVEDYVAATHSILSIRHATQTQKTLPQATDDAIAEAERAIAGQQTAEDKGLDWPWPDWNKRFGAARGGELIILAARPGVGKSSSARQCAMQWATGGDVLLFSREMPIGQLPHLFAQQVSGVSWKLVRSGDSMPHQAGKFIESLREVKGMKGIKVFDRDRTLAQLTARVKAYSQMNPVRAIIVDYLQRYDPQQERSENRDIALGRMTMAFKDMAIDLKVPCLVLAQIGRGVERESRTPRLSDLRESGNLEQDADRVIFLHAPEKNPIDNTIQDPYDGTVANLYVEAVQAKGRGEGQDRANLVFHRPTTTFKSISV